MAFKPTEQQDEIVAGSRTGGDMVIQAGAGSGKTSTLKLISGAMPKKKLLFVAYNKAIQVDAAKSFPKNATCKTSHALAFGSVGVIYKNRLNGPRQTSRDVANILGIREPERIKAELAPLAPQQLARITMETVKNFCYSGDDTIDWWHVPHQNGLEDKADHIALTKVIVPMAQRAWKDIENLNGRLRFQHDFYLKLWALSRPQLGADIVLLDEAQDSNPAVAGVIMGQTNAQVIMVGDAAQSIYGWRGARDAMSTFHGKQYLLSQSFRFGPRVADEANKWLDIIEAPLRLTGFDQIPSVLAPLATPDAVLCRTNAGAIREAMIAFDDGRRPALVGGGEQIKRLALAALDLKNGRPTSHPELYPFPTWASVQDYAEHDSSGSDLKSFVKLIDDHGAEEIIDVVDQLSDERYADVIISTAHKCVHPGTLVETPQGIMPIKDIPACGRIATPSGVREYHSKFTKQAGPVVTFGTRRGYELTVSPEHGMTVWRNSHTRVEAADVTTGDWFRMRLGATADPSNAPALPPAPPVDPRGKTYHFPSAMTVEAAELIGLMVADGTVFNKGFRVAKRYRSVVDRFVVLVKELFGYDAKIGYCAGITPKAEVHSVQIAEWLRQVAGMSPNRKGIPPVVLRSPLAMQAAFLRGLFEDGTVNRRGDDVDHIHWENKDFDLVGTVQTMLLRFGIVSTRRFHHGIGTLYIYSQNAARFADRIGFIAAEKNALLDGARFGEDRACLIPVNRAELALLEPFMKATDKRNARTRGYLSRRLAEHLNAKTDGTTFLAERLGWHYERVTSMKMSESETMCVTVPEGSRFLQNGFDGWNSKGLEWNKVQVSDDFREPTGSDKDAEPKASREEAMLAYVTVTRAKKVLDRGGLSWVDRFGPGGRLKPQFRDGPTRLEQERDSRETITVAPVAPMVSDDLIAVMKEEEGLVAAEVSPVATVRSRTRKPSDTRRLLKVVPPVAEPAPKSTCTCDPAAAARTRDLTGMECGPDVLHCLRCGGGWEGVAIG